jgi:hypothetical protein
MGIPVQLKDVRISFIEGLWTPKAFKGQGDPRYGARLMVPKGSPADIAVRAAIEEAATQEWPKEKERAQQLKSFVGNSNKYCYIDGENSKYEDDADYMLLSAVRKQKDGAPRVVDRQNNTVTEASGVIYAGCYGNAWVEIWAQNGPNYFGMRCTLVGLQYFRKGDAFSGGLSPNAAQFDNLGDEDEEEDLVE